MRQQEFIGVGDICHVSSILAELGVKKILLVTGKTSYVTNGARRWVEQNLKKKISIIPFQDFEANPKIEDIERGVALMRQHHPDAVVAIGGGSVIDVAKAMNFLASQEGVPEDYIVEKTPTDQKGKPLIAIPTTAGTGSEATHFAVVYIGKTKYSLAYPQILPDYAIVDPQLTIDVPPRLTAATGFDALAQGIESYWSVKSTEESRAYSQQAIALALEHLLAAITTRTLISRAGMSRSAHLAGKAINIAQTTACHAISYPITSYFGVPHGHAVALTLGSMLVYNNGVSDADVQDVRGTEYVREALHAVTRLLGARDAQAASTKITTLMNDAGLEIHLRDLGIRRENIQTIIEHGFAPDRVKNNPRALTKPHLEELLMRIL